MKTYIKTNGTEITYKPLYIEASNTWQVARYENNKITTVFNHKDYATKGDCEMYLFRVM